MAPYTLHTDANYVGASLANSYSHILYEARLCGRARRVFACALPPEPFVYRVVRVLRLYCGLPAPPVLRTHCIEECSVCGDLAILAGGVFVCAPLYNIPNR